MWIVRLALRRPYTFTVMAILIVLMGIVTIFRMATDIFPSINIPVVSVIWSYSGVAPEEMEKRFVTVCERAMTTTVNDIQHIESQSYNGVAVIKVFFHEGAKVEAGVAQVTSICQTLFRIMPPGTTPPLIIQYSASNVPILQLGSAARAFPSSNSTTSASTSSAPSSPPSREPRSRCLTAARRARSWWILIRESFSQRAFLPPTSARPSARRMSSCREARKRSASANIACA